MSAGRPRMPNLPAGKSVVLVGLMGAGKTKIGSQLATKLGLPFADADAEIEEAAGCSIADIFDRFGESSFRDGERRVIDRLLNGEAKVLATGGGAYLEARTRELIAERGISIWLRAELDLLVRRTARREHRPLLKGGDPREILEKLMTERYPFYAQADITIDVTDEAPDSTTGRVLAALVEFTGDDARAAGR